MPSGTVRPRARPSSARWEDVDDSAGQPGVRLRCCLDLRRQLTAAAVPGPTVKPARTRP
ncbi:DUF6207 family protein [Streptomyces sp. NPDC017249]|uniref:DUF6207 family protein n=1 Tax=unclassified Streptomyces TaxID=2593676 RepID=UPI003798043C